MADPIEINSTSSSTADILGLDDINVDLNLGLPQPLKTEGTNSLTLDPVKADLGTDSHVKIDPLKTDSGLTIDLKPLKTESSMSLDLKPAVVDLCLTLNVGKIPNLCIKQPYHHHVGFTMWGTEVWGFTFSGQQETVVQEQHPSPAVAVGDMVGNWTAHEAPRRVPERPKRESGGLRIRVEP